MEGGNNGPTSKELLFCSGDEESKLFVADGKDRVNPKPPQISRLPPSALLAQARSFLPMLAAANAKLEQTLAENPGSLDIENVEEGKPYDLAMIGEKKDGESSDSEDDSDDDDDSKSESNEEANEEEEAGEKEEETTKAPAQRRKPIEEIGGEEEEQGEKEMEE
ncbi:uncharacterized protein ACA1_277710 [Acanthamoeba castellanii str. Neff]|uniref:Uncharacterized protein n=1 Tax=Acanthamoeba castellanii (strain ATCC 30010 / Neff) TaxID=1257118 RepID=L8H6H0_ACACF|nr:uncharacterized protein ACA1_277710 [Acanthamoeba castellanii str. Neff]ELR20842.1 hypothetical protein ACA1_277710 [Acanthamoeba castellanii str. Neff]